MHKTRTSAKEKIVLFVIAMLLAVLIIELGFASFIISASQRITNIPSGTFNDMDEKTYRILALGESTTVGLGYNSWPMQLEYALNNRTKKIKFKVYNEAAGGVSTLYIIGKLEENIERYHPDMVITMMGINDWRYPCCIYDEKEDLFLSFLSMTKSYKIVKFIAENILGNYETDKKAKRELVYSESDIEKYIEKGLLKKEDGIIVLAKEIPKNILVDEIMLDLIYLELGYRAKENKNYLLSLVYFKKALEVNPSNDEAFLQAGWIYRDFYNDTGSAKDMFQRAAEANQNNAQAVYSLIDLSRDETGSILKKYYGITSKPSSGSDQEILTDVHYRELYGILQKNNIVYAAVQYPTLDIGPIEGFFSKDEQPGIIFIENKNNFRDALMRNNYEKYFFDEFASDENKSMLFYGRFGHATNEGNKLIAENAADAIIDYLNISSK
jgi:tetratricopeptide (TPR) repeat protein